LDARQIDLILASARLRRFSAKSAMTHQGEPSAHLFLLWKGRARYFFITPGGRKIILRWITPGQVFGVGALAPQPSRYLVSTEAVRDSAGLVWDGPTIRNLGRRFPELLENAVLITADYILWYVAAHTGLISQTAPERLASVLWGLANRFGQKSSVGIELDVTNEELAYSANITPYTTSRIMRKWKKIGAIHKKRGKIVLYADRFFSRVA
jgi:CRP-like cAMP-binding protein